MPALGPLIRGRRLPLRPPEGIGRLTQHSRGKAIDTECAIDWRAVNFIQAARPHVRLTTLSVDQHLDRAIDPARFFQGKKTGGPVRVLWPAVVHSELRASASRPPQDVDEFSMLCRQGGSKPALSLRQWPARNEANRCWRPPSSGARGPRFEQSGSSRELSETPPAIIPGR